MCDLARSDRNFVADQDFSYPLLFSIMRRSTNVAFYANVTGGSRVVLTSELAHCDSGPKYIERPICGYSFASGLAEQQITDVRAHEWCRAESGPITRY